MESSSAPSHSTSLLNFYADHTALEPLAPAPTTGPPGTYDTQPAPYDHIEYVQQASAYVPGQSFLGGPSSTAWQSGVKEPPIFPSIKATSDFSQPTTRNSAAQETGESTGHIKIVVACEKCRSRKVRCDGVRPSCSNCHKRNCSASCTYATIPGRRGPDKKPGRIRGPSRSSASIGKKKQNQKEIRWDNSARIHRIIAPDSAAVSSQPVQVEAGSNTQHFTSVPEQIRFIAPASIQTQQPVVGVLPAAISEYSTKTFPHIPVSQTFMPSTFTLDSLDRNLTSVPVDDQTQVYRAPDQRQSGLGAFPTDHSGTSHHDHAKSAGPSISPLYTDTHHRSRPPLNELHIPSPGIGLMPPSSSSSSQFPPSSTQLGSGYDSYLSYQHGNSHQSVYALTLAATEPTSTNWAPMPSSVQPFTSEWSVDGQEQRWNTSDQQDDTATYGQQVGTSDLQVWGNKYDASHFQYGQTSQGMYTNVNTIVKEPSLHFSCETWWDSVLYIYGTDQTSFSQPSSSLQPLSWHGSRRDAAAEISNDIYSFFKIASNWLSFINVPLFLGQFHHAEYRARMQPSLVLIILAYFKFLQTSQEARVSGEGNGIVKLDATEKMWRKSVMLRELAQAAFDASYNAGWIDTPLAQAAWILGLYEFSAHRDTNPLRMESSLIVLDNVVHVLGLKTLDRFNPRAAVFRAGTAPVLGRLRPDGQVYQHLNPYNLGSQGHARLFLKSIEPPRPSIQYQATTQQTPFDLYRSVYNPTQGPHGCPCHALSLAGSSEAQKSTPLWLSTPKWDPEASLAEIQKEEARRLVWSTVTVVGADAAARLALGRPQLYLHAAKPENYAVLLPGEELYASRPQVDIMFSGKESTWALHGRTMLLWYACVAQIAAIKKAAPISFLNGNVNGGLSFTPEQLAAAGPDHADFAMRAWMESLAIEEALNEHTCDGEKATMYQAREILFTIRMFITGGFRQYIPHPQSGVDFSRLDREKAMQWLHHQNNVANQLQMIIGAENSPVRYLLIKRPYVMWWQMNLIGRALQLWVLDHSLTFAVDVALNIYPILKWFGRVWPCPEQESQAVSLVGYLTNICNLLGKHMSV
ncbi:hypothetical protein FRB95_013240 [Tulasnella sp. JGI-2019a]|nr:hypothetical protein FRB95_013240 [Tulasnella sp. JGI-2019a]